MNFYEYYAIDYRLRVQEGERIAALYHNLPREERARSRKVRPLEAAVTVRHGNVEEPGYPYNIAA